MQAMSPLLSVLTLAVVTAAPAFAQTVTVTPTLNTRLTWTDNVDTTGENPKQDWIAEVSPGISVSRASGRFRGYLDASLRNLVHARETDQNETFLAFRGNGEFEAIEDAVFIAASGSISRNETSSFGRRYSGDELSASEDNETRVWSIAPRYEFRFGDAGSGRLGYESRWLQGGSASYGDQHQKRWTLGVSDPGAFRLFGWGVDYVRTDNSYEEDQGRNVTQEVGRATLFVNVDPQFRVRAIGGYESNDYAVADGEEGAIWGMGFDWYPTERTNISVTGEDRIFGTGYDVQVRHRMARSVWNVSVSRDITSSLDELAGGFVLDPVFQLFYQLTDPALPEAERVRIARSAYERAGGVGIRTNTYFVQRSARAGVTFTGARNTLSVSLNQTERQRLNTFSGFLLTDDFSEFDYIKTRSASVSLSHKLSGLATLNGALTRSKSEGQGSSRREVDRSIFTVGVTRKLGSDTTGGLNYRYQKAEGTDDYTENAVTATLGMRF
ncbi:MAG: hypothetical protein PWP11_1319 [Thauera sp.]|nr:TIGR03016 family PEP-CTERM system-associated outer membrane protein [Thauera sp.]MDI3490042.1 hypothetical protein [Thauera sp.]